MFRALTLLIAGGIVLCGPGLAAAESAMDDAIRAEAEALRQTGHLRDGRPIEFADLIAEFYDNRDYAPAWRAASRVAEARGVIRDSYEHGLRPDDYGIGVIEEWSRWRAGFDIWLSDRVLALAFDLRHGKTRRDQQDEIALFEHIANANSVAEAVAVLAPSTPRYRGLREALRQYRKLTDRGGWPVIPDGPTIGPDSDDPRIAVLRKRLVTDGDLAAIDVENPAYDHVLEAAVRHFQKRQGLTVDGLVGKKTLRALNVPVEQRIDQIRINLERQRWIHSSEAADYIYVNVPAFRAYVYLDGRLRWTTKVIVGEPDDKTPLFESEMTSVVFNPTWSVPYSIASEEMLPKIQRDPDYLRRGNYHVFDRSGTQVDPDSVDWSVIRQNTFPFTIQQQAGPGNELGRIKFLFPNQYSVCMHDTPGKALFERARRSFSHGCIRVDEPQYMAEVVLSRQGWTGGDVNGRLRSGETSTVALESPVPIALVYWTADVDEEGILFSYEDIYDRDAALLAALDGV